ncbi:MAG: hypothetical protein R3251_02905, partial [Candidatus Spechtbacterales bacterium]|nr:hypothetical protein [Candidatus Spechtbacterales bacterium]
GYVLVGLIPIKRFIQALQEEAGLNETTAKNVAHDIRAEIFAPVAQDLSAIQEKAEKNWEQLHLEQKGDKDINAQKTAPTPSIPAANAPDESVAREVFPAPEIKEDKLNNNQADEITEDKKDNRF